MIKLKITCVRGAYLTDDCVRVVAMDDSASLLDLHYIIQEAVSFDDDHLFEFFTANSDSPRAKRNWFSMTEDWDDRRGEFGAIELGEIWPLGRKKLYYWFDFGDAWIFEVRKLRSSKADASISTPRILERIGPNPVQYPKWEE